MIDVVGISYLVRNVKKRGGRRVNLDQAKGSTDEAKDRIGESTLSVVEQTPQLNSR